LLIALFLFTGANQQVFGQSETGTQDSAKVEQVVEDSTGSDREDNSFLESKVDYNAEDSMIIDMQQQKAYLYGNAIVTYEDLKLEADYIEIDFNSNLVMAKGLPDSTGEVKGKPLFTEKGQQYEAGQMTYNFKTKKGKIKDALTQQGDGYIHGQDIKKENDNIFFIKNGRYTTCNKEDPHFYILASKLKVINNEKIVTGPANMWISDIPTPLAIPFGFFPNKRGRQSGVMIPSYGFSPERGYFLQNGGFYLGLNDNFDAIIRGDIYSNLSWSTNTRVNYKKSYKRKG
jgi:lipopolysaccharide assembly outer membrane protein LptD (OstA)